MKKFNKKPLIAIGLIALIGVIGGTLAIFSNSVEIPNIFKTGIFKNTITETFTSPEDWTPGTTTPKTIDITNDGNVPVVVRAYYEEEWKSSKGQPLGLDKNGKKLVTVNLDNEELWTAKEEEGKTYYYYKYILEQNDKVESFIQSVTFNEDVTFEDEITCSESKDPESGTLTKTCESSGEGYAGGTYTLTIHIDVVQYDGFETEWTSTDFEPERKDA